MKEIYKWLSKEIEKIEIEIEDHEKYINKKKMTLEMMNRIFQTLPDND